MAQGFALVSDVSSYLNSIFERAILVAQAANIATDVATVMTDRSDDNARKFSQFSEATISSIAESDDLVSQTFTPSVVSTFTPAEAGAQIFLTDRRIRSDPFQVRDMAARELGQKMAKKIDKDILGDMASFTGGTVGAAGTVITWSGLFAARDILSAAGIPGPYTAVLHTYHWFVLAKSASIASGQAATNAPALQDQITSRWYVRTVGDLDIYTTPHIDIDSSTDAKSGVFNRLALGYDERKAPGIEPERDASRRGWELNATMEYAHGNPYANYGVTLYFDAATPSY